MCVRAYQQVSIRLVAARPSRAAMQTKPLVDTRKMLGKLTLAHFNVKPVMSSIARTKRMLYLIAIRSADMQEMFVARPWTVAPRKLFCAEYIRSVVSRSCCLLRTPLVISGFLYVAQLDAPQVSQTSPGTYVKPVLMSLWIHCFALVAMSSLHALCASMTCLERCPFCLVKACMAGLN